MIQTVHNFHDFHDAISFKEMDTRYFFRGISSEDYKLTPKIGRTKELFELGYYTEKSIFQRFKNQAWQYLNHKPSNDWEWLAIAQHHGLPTRLLDWSTNPLVALYFCVTSESDEDGAVYVLTYKAGSTALDTKIEQNPFKISKSFLLFSSPNVTNRISA